MLDVGLLARRRNNVVVTCPCTGRSLKHSASGVHNSLPSIHRQSASKGGDQKPDHPKGHQRRAIHDDTLQAALEDFSYLASLAHGDPRLESNVSLLTAQGVTANIRC